MKISTPLPSSFNKRRLIYYLISYTIFAVTAIFFICFVSLNIQNYLDDDMASEMVLAKLMAENKTFLVKDWAYSTELRLVHMQLFMVPLFYLTSNWYVIRVVATILMIATMILSLFFFMSAIQQKLMFPIVASLFLLPISFSYRTYILYYLCYTIHLIWAFIILGLLFYTLKTERKKLKYIYLGLLIVISILTGLTSIRNLVNIFIPAFASVFILWLLNLKTEKSYFWKKAVLLNIIMCIAGSIGTIIYCILAKQYGIYIFGHSDHFSLNFNPRGFSNIWNNFLEIFQLNSNFNLLWLLILIVMIITTLKKSSKLNDGERFVTILLTIGIIIYAGIAMFTENLYYYGNSEDDCVRYIMPIAIFVIFIIAGFLRMLFNTWKTKSFKILQICCFALIGLTYLYPYIYDYYFYFHYVNNEIIVRKAVIATLDEHQCNHGYGIYNNIITKNINVLTELSNGKISVKKIYIDKSQNTSIDSEPYWLTQKSLYETKPQGKVFVIFTDQEYETFAIAQYFTNLDYLVMNENEVKLFIYDSYDEMVTVTGVEHRF